MRDTTILVIKDAYVDLKNLTHPYQSNYQIEQFAKKQAHLYALSFNEVEFVDGMFGLFNFYDEPEQYL